MELIRRNESFTKDKKLVNYTAFYLNLGNGVSVKIIPVFKADYNTLRLCSKENEK